MIAFWVAGIALAVCTVRSTSGTGRPDRDQALGVLDECFARDDIDQQDYEEQRRILQSHP